MAGWHTGRTADYRDWQSDGPTFQQYGRWLPDRGDRKMPGDICGYSLVSGAICVIKSSQQMRAICVIKSKERMIDIDRFYELLNEVCDELPDDFFRELHYGVHLSEECKLSPYAENGDLIVLGEYNRSRQGNKITIYYGSFARSFGWMPEDQLKEKLRSVVRHEFRHHMENLGGVYGADSLEHEDMEEIKGMICAREEKKKRQ